MQLNVARGSIKVSVELLSRQPDFSPNPLVVVGPLLSRLQSIRVLNLALTTASIGNTSSHSRQARTGNRRNSLDPPGVAHTSRFESNSTSELPPSSTYMPPYHPYSVSSSTSTDRPSTPVPRFAAGLQRNPTHPIPIYSRSLIDGAVYPSFVQVSRPRSITVPVVVPPTTSFDRLSLSRTSSSHVDDSPSASRSTFSGTSIEAYSLSAMDSRSRNNSC
jgi:hypothetical protein